MNAILGKPTITMTDISCMSLKRADISTAIAKYLAISISHFPNSDKIISHKIVPIPPLFRLPTLRGSSVSASGVRVLEVLCEGV